MINAILIHTDSLLALALAGGMPLALAIGSLTARAASNETEEQ
jgi:hypothetical protein